MEEIAGEEAINENLEQKKENMLFYDFSPWTL